MSSKEEAEFAAVLAEIEAEGVPDDGADEGEVLMESDQGEDPVTDEDTEAEAEAEADGEESEGDEPLETSDNEVFKNEIADLLDQGNLKKACEKLGVDPAIFKINNRQFAAIRKGESKARKFHTEAENKIKTASQKEAQAEKLHKTAELTYGPIVAGSKSAREGDWSRAKAAVELMFEMPFETVVDNIKKGVKPLDPAQAEILKLRAELQEEKAKKNQDDAKAVEQGQYQKDLQTVSTKLTGTPLEGVEGAAEDIVKVIRASYDPGLKKYSLTLKEAYKKVKETYQKKAAQLAKLSGAPTAKPSKAPKAPAPQSRAPLASQVRRPSSAKVTAEDEFAASIKEAAMAASAAERRNRRSR